MMESLDKVANTKGWMAALEAASKSNRPAMDWLGFEATLRAFTKSWSDGAEVTPMDLSSIIAAFTKRGPAV